jgi:hypothetical protein
MSQEDLDWLNETWAPKPGAVGPPPASLDPVAWARYNAWVAATNPKKGPAHDPR